MNYKPDDFMALMEEVERQGGGHLSNPCVPHEFRIKQPDARGELKMKRVYATGCGRDARFVVPYEPLAPSPAERKAMLARGAGFATVCAVDDNVGVWPRFLKGSQDAQTEDEETQDGS